MFVSSTAARALHCMESLKVKYLVRSDSSPILGGNHATLSVFLFSLWDEVHKTGGLVHPNTDDM